MKEQEYEQINHPNGVTTWKTKPKHKEQAMNREDIIRMAREAGFVVDDKAQQYQPNCIFHTQHMVDELDEDILRTKSQFKGTLDVQFDKFAYAIEAKLREKNA